MAFWKVVHNLVLSEKKNSKNMENLDVRIKMPGKSDGIAGGFLYICVFLIFKQ